MRVLIFGTFDHFHPGHEFFIMEAMKRGKVTVIVARDHHVEFIKGKASEQSENERARAIKDAFPDVDVSLGDARDFLAPLRKINPNLILLGYDQKLPPGVTEADLPCRTERLPPFRPDEFKSSLRRKSKRDRE